MPTTNLHRSAKSANAPAKYARRKRNQLSMASSMQLPLQPAWIFTVYVAVISRSLLFVIRGSCDIRQMLMLRDCESLLLGQAGYRDAIFQTGHKVAPNEDRQG